VYQQVRLHIDRKTGKRLININATQSHPSPNLAVDHQSPCQVVIGSGASGQQNQDSLEDNVGFLNNRSDSTSKVGEQPSSRAHITHNHDQFDPSLNNETADLGMAASLAGNSNQDMYSDTLPFDNLNVQELWTWMGELDGYDNYSYTGSYESTRSL
jgi:hypothetical protein